jgi:hypothetical protein
MKTKLMYLGILAFSIMLLCSGCKKDNKDNGPENYFKYNGKTYSLADGFLEYYGLWSGTGYNFDVNLYSSGITYDGEDFQGTGNAVYLEMYSSSSASLASGTYTYDESSSEDPLTFDEGMFGMKINMSDGSGTVTAVGSGTVKVSKSGEAYEFTFSCKNSNNQTISGYFKGTLDYYDYSEKKSNHVKVNKLNSIK